MRTPLRTASRGWSPSFAANRGSLDRQSLHLREKDVAAGAAHPDHEQAAQRQHRGRAFESVQQCILHRVVALRRVPRDNAAARRRKHCGPAGEHSRLRILFLADVLKCEIDQFFATFAHVLGEFERAE